MDQSALPTVLQTVKTRLVVKMAPADFVVLVIVDLVVPITSAFWGSRMDLAPPHSTSDTPMRLLLLSLSYMRRTIVSQLSRKGTLHRLYILKLPAVIR
jgi:hypothetical protein